MRVGGRGSDNPNILIEPAARKEILKQNKNCFICFDFGYVAKNCNWDYKCKKCNGKHNVIICTFSNDQGDRFNLIDENSETSNSNNLATNSGSILLQTAYTKVSNLSTQKEANVCVLFETGSHRSYISDELRNYLKLQFWVRSVFSLKYLVKLNQP